MLVCLEKLCPGKVYDQIFLFGAGVVDGEGGNSERCLKVNGG